MSLASLPPEVLVRVLRDLRPDDLAAVRLACRSLAAAADNPAVWRHRTVTLTHVARINRYVPQRMLYRSMGKLQFIHLIF